MASKDWSFSRSQAQPFLEGLARTNLSGRGILSLLQDQGIGYNRSNFFADLRRIRGTAINEPNVSRLRSDSFVPRRWITESPLAHANRYRYDYIVTTRDPTTGAVFHNKRSMTYSKYVSKGEAEEIFTKEPDWTDKDRYPLEFVSCRLISLVHREGDPFP